jgi:hypothetical protein
MTIKQKETINKLREEILRLKRRKKKVVRLTKKISIKDIKELKPLLESWILVNIKTKSKADFFMDFEKFFRKELRKSNYSIKGLEKITK